MMTVENHFFPSVHVLVVLWSFLAPGICTDDATLIRLHAFEYFSGTKGEGGI